MGMIIFNGLSSYDLGMHVESYPGHEIPEKDYEIIHVPGKNGDVIIDKGSYKNTTRTYTLSFDLKEKKFSDLSNRIIDWLYSTSGYARLEESYEPEFYRLAVCNGNNSINKLYDQAGVISVSFNCKPQRFFKDGDDPITYTKNSKIINPTCFSSSPIITIHGSGSGELKIGEYSVSISSIINPLTIDCDMKEVYSNSTNCNSKVIFQNGFPKILPGENLVLFSGGITSVEVIPKWWTL